MTIGGFCNECENGKNRFTYVDLKRYNAKFRQMAYNVPPTSLNGTWILNYQVVMIGTFGSNYYATSEHEQPMCLTLDVNS